MVDHAKNVEMITEIILQTDSEERGVLFFLISEELEKRTIFYTASLIRKLADEYGYPNKENSDDRP